MQYSKLEAITSINDIKEILPTLFDYSPENVCLYDEVGRVVYGNPTLNKSFGVTRSEDAKPSDINHPQFKIFYDNLQEVIRLKEPRTFLLNANINQDLRRFYDQIYMSPIMHKNGRLIGVLATGRDLNYEAHLAADNEKKHAQYLRALLDSFPFIVWMKDHEGRFLEVNQKFAEIVKESTPKKLYGKTDFDYFPQEMAQGYVDDDKKVVQSGAPLELVELIQKANGDVYWAETYKAPVTVDGKTIGSVGFARDITEKKQLLAELQKRSKEYETLVEHLPMTIIRYDLNCRRIYISSYCHRVHSIQEQYDLGKTPLEQWSPNIVNMTGEEFHQHLETVINTKTEYNCELYSHHEEKTTVHYVKIVPEFDENQQIIGALTISQDMTETAEYRTQIENLAYKDTLTDLPNRENFNRKLALLIESVKIDNANLSILVIDLDHFKGINDTLGHTIGDQLLNEVSVRIRNSIRKDDLLARLGGDEFAIIVSNVRGVQNLSVLAQKIINLLSTPFKVDEKEFFISASIGIASFPEHTKIPENLLKYADAAMYVAKKNGRNNFQYFSQDIDEGNALRLTLQTELRHAIRKNELYIDYQPIYDLRSNQPVRYEALMRWYNQELKQVSPADFISVAEEFGIIIEIGEWMILEVCKQAAEINLHRKTPLVFAINLSPRQFIRNDILKTLKKGLARYRCEPSWIEVEITEGLLLNHSPETLNTLQSIARMGMHIAIDDFGTGYSSLSYLNKYPISTVKIDQSFTRDITNDINDAKLVKAIIEMAKSLDKNITAEGIETEQQMIMLNEWGCELGQGYLLGRPQRPEKTHW
jgi:diguanylate cyclase (GGDEF)-like protein/PAS domain S-box-containing protein